MTSMEVIEGLAASCAPAGAVPEVAYEQWEFSCSRSQPSQLYRPTKAQSLRRRYASSRPWGSILWTLCSVCIASGCACGPRIFMECNPIEPIGIGGCGGEAGYDKHCKHRSGIV